MRQLNLRSRQRPPPGDAVPHDTASASPLAALLALPSARKNRSSPPKSGVADDDACLLTLDERDEAPFEARFNKPKASGRRKRRPARFAHRPPEYCD